MYMPMPQWVLRPPPGPDWAIYALICALIAALAFIVALSL
jgi:hypothetical protein